MAGIEVPHDHFDFPYALLLSSRTLWGVERGIWERWPVRKAVEIDLSAWVDQHAGPGSQLELWGEGV